ncbi:3-oxoadipate enol-lactonase [Amycolatopsis thermoflava]|uniref:3-oxoadipate enol-lactonase n=1 Tax=Amycolatopsis thermoflava TaxID=84480 RepID=UPI00365CD81C
MSSALRHRVDGPEDAPVVVLGPSLGTDLTFFDDQVHALKSRWRVIRFDLPGHGGSPAPPGPYSIADLAGRVLDLLRELGVDRFGYVGVSIGGAIGQWLGVHHTDVVTSLVVCTSAARFGDPQAWRDRAARVRREGTDWLIPSRHGTWFTAGFARRDPDRVAWLLDMLRGTEPEGYAGCCEAIAGFDIRDLLARITAPTLVIAGERDPATPVSSSREIAGAVPGARLVVVPGASHLANVERPDVVDQLISEHLEAGENRCDALSRLS